MATRLQKRIEIPGVPISLKRPRFSEGKVYNSQAKEKKTISHIIKNKWGKFPVDGLVELTICYHLPIARSLSKKKKDALKNELHTVKPDLDNLVKWTLDCMNKIVFKDDCQVSTIACRKVFDDNPKTTILIEWPDKEPIS